MKSFIENNLTVTYLWVDMVFVNSKFATIPSRV